MNIHYVPGTLLQLCTLYQPAHHHDPKAGIIIPNLKIRHKNLKLLNITRSQSTSSRALFSPTLWDTIPWAHVKIPSPGFICSSSCVQFSSDLGKWHMITNEQVPSNWNAYVKYPGPKFPQPPLLPHIKDKSLGKLVYVADCVFQEWL